MNYRQRAISNPANGLLNRQLASIADTLAKASQRRDEGIQTRKNRTSTSAIAKQATTPTNCSSNISDSTALNLSDSDNSYTESDQPQRGFDDVGTRNQRASMLTTKIGDSQLSLNKGYEADVEEGIKDTTVESTIIQKPSTITHHHSADMNDDSRRILSSIDTVASSSALKTIGNNQKILQADLQRQMRSFSQDLYHKTLHDLDSLRDGLNAMTSFLRDQKSHSSNASIERVSNTSGVTSTGRSLIHAGPFNDGKATVDQKSVEYALAFGLEHENCEWTSVRYWTACLFSSRLDGYKAQQRKVAIIKQATKELDDIIRKSIEDELEYHNIEDQERLQCRLLVSNLATDAGEEELRIFFHQYKYDIRDIVFLDEPEPTRRTRIARVDMWTRKAAIRASYAMGHIFGLTLKISLAAGDMD